MRNQENRDVICEYVEERRANQLSRNTIEDDRITLELLDDFLDKPFREATKHDMVRFCNWMQDRYASGTIHLRKVKVKLFYSWLYNLQRGEYPDCVKWIRPTNPNKDKLPIQPEDLLTRPEIKKLIEACNHTRNQALFSVLYESGARAKELLGLKVKNVSFDKQGGVITLKGKTGQRRIRLVESIPYLQAWLNVHPFRGKPDSPLWYSTNSKSGIGYAYLYKLTKRLSREAGIKKKVTPHVLRHSRLTELAKYLPEQKLKVFAGWTPDSGMASVYVHLSGKDLDEDILSLHGLEEQKTEAPLKQTSLTPVECPRCKRKNPPTAKYCQFCGMVLDEEEAVRMMERQNQPLHQIIKSEMKDIAEYLNTIPQQHKFQQFMDDVQREVEQAVKDVQRQNMLALKEWGKLRKLINEKLKD